MKIRAIGFNNRKRSFAVATDAETLVYPYAKADPAPTSGDPVTEVRVDEELAREGFVFTVESGRETTVHLEQVLEYNQHPTYLRDLLLYQLTLEAQRRVSATALSKRELIRRLGTSATQLYRLLDQSNYRKSVDQILNLLHVLDCEVDLVVATGPSRLPQTRGCGSASLTAVSGGCYSGERPKRRTDAIVPHAARRDCRHRR